MSDRRTITASPDPGPPVLTPERLALVAAIAAGEVCQYQKPGEPPYAEWRVKGERRASARRVTGEVRWLRSHNLARLGEQPTRLGAPRPILLTPAGRELLP